MLLPFSAVAIDLDGLEATVSNQTCLDGDCKTDCDSSLAKRVGVDLPSNADSCHAKSQYRLLNKGLYLAVDGKTYPLKKDFHSLAEQKAIALSDISKQAVHEKVSPYVIDLDAKVDASESLQSISHKLLASNMNQAVVTASSVQPIKKKPKQQLANQSKLGCLKFSTFAHRGGASSPENSIPAVIAGLKDGQNGVEIDTQRLSDRQWVVHHDPMIGRSSYGESGFVNLLSSDDWKKVYLLDRKGQQSKVKAPLLKDLLSAFKQSSSTGQVINIEIKMIKDRQYSCEQLADLEQQVGNILKPSQFLFTSTFLSALQCMRNINHDVYLGMIIEPNPASLKRIIDTRYGAEFRSFKTTVPHWLQGKLQKRLKVKHKSNREWLEHKNYTDLASLIGPNFGLHIDYRDMDKVAAKVQRSGARWMAYELNDDKGLFKALKLRLAQKKALPTAIIIDSSRRSFCQL